MPIGRKTGANTRAQKGGGFGKSLISATRAKDGANFTIPNASRCRTLGDREKKVTVNDFVAKDKQKISILEAKNLDDYFSQTLSAYEISSKSLVSKVLVMNDRNRVAQVNKKLHEGDPTKEIPEDIPLCKRPFTFRQPHRRLLHFANHAIKFLTKHSQCTLTDQEILSEAINIKDAQQLLDAIRDYCTIYDNIGSLVEPEELEARETMAFANWRNVLQDYDQQTQNKVISPYERNPAYWKQLWRTIERSDVVLEILDARNPLMFRSRSLEKLITENERVLQVVMNKTDFLSSAQQEDWRAYFERENVDVIFYSALLELQKQQVEPTTTKLNKEFLKTLNDATSSDEESNNDATGSDKESKNQKCRYPEFEDQNSIPPPEGTDLMMDLEALELHFENLSTELLGNKVASRAVALRVHDYWSSLIETLTRMQRFEFYTEIATLVNETIQKHDSEIHNSGSSETDDDESKEPPLVKLTLAQKTAAKGMFESLVGPRTSLLPSESGERLVIGTIGFPNVGKSSLINSLLRGRSRVGVSRTPGKTRHLQTLNLDTISITLCDCPGLVVPTWATSREELVINAVMSPDTFR